MTNWSELRVDLPPPGAGKSRLIHALRAALESRRGDGRRRRQRKPNIRRMIAAAERGGKNVTSITTPDGVTLHFGKGEPTEASNPWPLDDFKVTKR